jgi:hypothetical protein
MYIDPLTVYSYHNPIVSTAGTPGKRHASIYRHASRVQTSLIPGTFFTSGAVRFESGGKSRQPQCLDW